MELWKVSISTHTHSSIHTLIIMHLMSVYVFVGELLDSWTDLNET